MPDHPSDIDIVHAVLKERPDHLGEHLSALIRGMIRNWVLNEKLRRLVREPSNSDLLGLEIDSEEIARIVVVGLRSELGKGFLRWPKEVPIEEVDYCHFESFLEGLFKLLRMEDAMKHYGENPFEEGQDDFTNSTTPSI